MTDTANSIRPLVRIVDDEASVRNSAVFNMRVAGIDAVSYESAVDFLEHDDLKIPGCVVLDVRMPEMSGLELQDVMIERGIDLPIVFLTGHGDVSMAVSALQKGAGDFCEKPVEPAVLREKVKKFCEQSIAHLAEKAELTAMREAFETLTSREKDVMRLVAKDQMNKVIAIDLGIQEHTVKIHRANACRKLNVRSAIEIHNYLLRINELD